MATKGKTAKVEPTLLDELSRLLRNFVADFKTNSAASLEELRARDPGKYLELSVKLIAFIATLKTEPNEFERAKSMQDIGRSLLKSVGCPEDFMSDAVVEETIQANDKFIATLQAIRAKAEGEIH
jgi:hypothetical protein